MSYYLESVNFLDKQSIIDSDVSELFNIAFFCKNEYNFENRQNKVEKKIEYNYQKVVQLCRDIFIEYPTIQYQDDRYQEYKKIFYEKYDKSNIDGNIYTYPINIIYSDDKFLEDKLIRLKNSDTILKYNPNAEYQNDLDEPWWVEKIIYPNKLDEVKDESYYTCVIICKYYLYCLDTIIRSLPNPKKHYMEYYYYVYIFDNRYYKVIVVRDIDYY